MSDYKGVLIIGETDENQLLPISLELLGIGRKIADDLSETVSIVFFEKSAEKFSQLAVQSGADKVFIIEDAPTESYEGASYTAILEELCYETIKPSIILFGQTLIGRDLAPRLAFRLKSGLVTDCTDIFIEAESKQFIAKKPIAGGNVLAGYTFREGCPKLVTVRCKAMEPMTPDETRQGETVNSIAGIDNTFVKAKIVQKVKEETEGPNLETAEIIVSGGRGIGTPEEFEKYITKGLAKVLGAAVGGTRAAVDFGLISEQNQVGLTGKIVGPSLYFAVALSGAIQHITGCAGSKNIVAINKDEDAQIFNFARFGIVGDYKKVLPPLMAKLSETLEN